MRKYGYKRPCATLYVNRRRTRAKQPSFFFKRIFFIFLCVLVGGGLFFGGRAAYRAFAQAQFKNWHIQSVVVSGMQPAQEQQVRKQVSAYQDKTFSMTDATHLERQFAKQFPMLKEVHVSRGFFSGKLKISARPRQAVARFVLPDHSYKYLDDTGTVYEDPSGPHELLHIELTGQVPAQLSAPLVDGVRNMLKLSKSLSVRTLLLAVPDGTVTWILDDKSVLHFGSSEQLKDKVFRAGQILTQARATYQGPFTLDFTYFKQGKVFLTHSSH